MRLAPWLVALGCWSSLAACSSDDDDSTAGTAGTAGTSSSGGGGEAADISDTCRAGCVATLAADCQNGPADQASCESDCHALETGKCGAQYATLQSCAEGKSLSCAQGYPIVPACADQQAAVVACLSG
jgi:hypothetical protein